MGGRIILKIKLCKYVRKRQRKVRGIKGNAEKFAKTTYIKKVATYCL